MQDVHGIKAVFCQVALHLAGGRPPIIMVAFQQPFLTRQVLDKCKVGLVSSSFMAQLVSPARMTVSCGEISVRQFASNLGR